MTESAVQKLITDWLELMRYFHYRNNTGAFKTQTGGFYRFGAVGSPDIIVIFKGQYIGIEVKGLKGKQSDNQKVFQARLEAAGGKYILAYTLEDVINNI